MEAASKIFTAYRALGLYADNVPITVRYHHRQKDNFVVSSVGRVYHNMRCSDLVITHISELHPDNIQCVSSDSTFVYTACHHDIRVCLRGKFIRLLKGHVSDVHTLMPFGAHLLSVDANNGMKIWDVKSGEVYSEMDFDPGTFHISAIAHPSSYLNKVLLGSKQGTMQLWNIKSAKLIFSFTGWEEEVTVLEQAPAIDVIAVGHASGLIVLHNIKFDETIIKLHQDWGKVTSIGFRTDGPPIMFSASTVGHIAIWDLEKQKLLNQITNAHSGPVVSVRSIPSEPLFVSSGPDNALRIWIFDLPDGSARLLKHRSGHCSPPNVIRYYDDFGEKILTGGQDSTVRMFSLLNDSLHKCLGTASENRKLAKKRKMRDLYKLGSVTAMACETSRQRDWDSAVTCHAGRSVVTTWDAHIGKLGKYRIEPELEGSSGEWNNLEALCVDISQCGNYCVMGYSSGHVLIHNIQSGQLRGSLGGEQRAHSGAVRGCSVDGYNRFLVTAGSDSLLKIWCFNKKEIYKTLEMSSGVAMLTMHRESSMLAVACDDFSLCVVDIDIQRVIRVFRGHVNQITGLTFSPDARWLVSAAMDSSIRTWDLPSGKLIDCFLVESPVVCLTMSPTGDYLASVHVDDLGVHLWANKTLFSFVSLSPLPEDFEPVTAALPSVIDPNKATPTTKDISDYVEQDYKSPEQLSAELVTLSLLPNSRWKNLVNLEMIRERNKPKQPPKVPKLAPFFIPTVSGLETTFDKSQSDEKSGGKSKILNFGALEERSPFCVLLDQCGKNSDFKPVLKKLKLLGPADIDLQIRSLSVQNGGSVNHQALFLRFIDSSLRNKYDFELIQSYFGLFIKVHGPSLSEEAVLVDLLRNILSNQDDIWLNLDELFKQSLYVIGYIKNAVI